ncbi:MAG TPA: HEAT repeat domain-containing protein [Planctomycetota bacterium]|nr:HEAT repeat domain-containing protein [Planctomycetota bacterium]
MKLFFRCVSATVLIATSLFAGEDAPVQSLPATARIMGKDVAGWIEHLKHYENENERKLAMLCLSEFGPSAAPAVPELQVLMKDELQANTRRWAIQTLGAIGAASRPALADLVSLISNVKQPESHRAAACAAAAQIDPEAASVRKAVLAAMRDGSREVRNAAYDASIILVDVEPAIMPALAKAVLSAQDARAASTALRCIGEAGVDPLSKAVERGDNEARMAAADALSHMGRLASAAVPVLVRTAKRERDEKVRTQLMLAAARIAPRDEAVLEALVEPLLQAEWPASKAGDQSAPPFETETRLLTSAGTAALPALRSGLRARDANVRKHMISILGKLRAPTREVIDDLVARLQDKSPLVRAAAVQTLDAFGPAAASARDALLNAAKEDPALQRAAELAALNVSRDPQKPRLKSVSETKDDQALLAALKDPNPVLRQEAAEALRTRSDDGGVIATALIDALKDSDEKVRIAAARSLSRFGKYSRTAMSIFIEWLDASLAQAQAPAAAPSADTPVRENLAVAKAALMALAGMGADARGALPSVINVAISIHADKDPELQKYLGVVLQVIGPDAVPLLVAKLKDADGDVRIRASRTLASMGVVGATAVPDLIEFSKSAVDADAKAGFDALQAMGEVAYGVAAPHLVNVLMADLFADRRAMAARTIGRMGIPKESDAKRVLDALQSALLDPEESVCRAAHTALVKIGAPALPRMRELLKLDEGQASYWWAVRVMARMRADPELVIPKLIELSQPGVRSIKEGAFAERGTAAELLGEYAPGHVNCIPHLVKLLGDRDEIVASAAKRSLALFGNAALEPVRAVLRSRNPDMRRLAVETLEAIRARMESAPVITE